MTGLLIFVVTALLLALALEPAHRRARREGWVAPTSTPLDRDRDRMTADLRQNGRLSVDGRRRGTAPLLRHTAP